MAVSLQRLGDDPRHFDGAFTGSAGSDTALETPQSNNPPFKPWKIYPPPPPPHWKFKASNTHKPEISHTHDDNDGDIPFEFSNCEIPGKGAWEWEMDEKGVFQVYEDLSACDYAVRFTGTQANSLTQRQLTNHFLMSRRFETFLWILIPC